MKQLLLSLLSLFIIIKATAQTEPAAGTWKTWFITSGKDYRLVAPPSYKQEIDAVIAAQQKIDPAMREQINYWNAGAPGYRWYEMIGKLWVTDTGYNGALANMLMGVGIYDATIAAWDTKYAFNRPRPFSADKRIKAYIVKPESPSYPCEHSVAAGVAVTIISHFYPSLADSVNRMAQRLMNSRIAAGAAFPGDTRAGFDLGKKIAQKEIEHTKDYTVKTAWDRKLPTEPGRWRGGFALLPLAGQSKTVVLTSGSQFRPAPPPDFAKEMAEIKNQKPTFGSLSNAFYHANQSAMDDILQEKIFEHNLHLNPPRVARIIAIRSIGVYDGFISCWDAKYAYWGIRPSQYDTTFKPAIMVTPPFPGYPSGHAMLSSVSAELLTYFFPADSAYFRKTAKEIALSRFQAGIHFRSDNDVAVEMGKKVAAAILERVKNDGVDKK
jgi:membrane-associated phospholipid phosphatase